MKLDHLVYAMRDLEAAITEFAARSGIQPCENSHHTRATSGGVAVCKTVPRRMA